MNSSESLPPSSSVNDISSMSLEKPFNFFEALFLHVWNKGFRVNNPFNLISFEILWAYASASQMNMDVMGNLIVLISFVLRAEKEFQDT